jgi:hypothetical protein
MIATVLAATIAVESRDRHLESEIEIVGQQDKSTPTDVQSARDQPDRLREWTQIILARPLFDSTRRPPGESAQRTDLPRLTGILVTKLKRTAIFALADNDKPLALDEGASLGSFTIRSILVTEVIVQGKEGDLTLHVSHAPAAPASTSRNVLLAPPPPQSGHPFELSSSSSEMAGSTGN